MVLHRPVEPAAVTGEVGTGTIDEFIVWGTVAHLHRAARDCLGKVVEVRVLSWAPNPF